MPGKRSSSSASRPNAGFSTAAAGSASPLKSATFGKPADCGDSFSRSNSSTTTPVTMPAGKKNARRQPRLVTNAPVIVFDPMSPSVYEVRNQLDARPRVDAGNQVAMSLQQSGKPQACANPLTASAATS